ncbi:acyltransferase family protein [Photorhabdus bodei]|uniref:acyltransferase family protein n=1 Tax=Photorhabdus bodei TaxID=2029681 RepID=UPI003D6DD6A3
MHKYISLDILKIIGILTVIMGHITNPFNNYIYLWHMPLFFFLSGLTFNYKSFRTTAIVKDAKRLLIPYFIFSTLALIVEISKRLLLSREWLNELPNLFTSIFFNISSSIHTYGFVLWFLPSLFIIKTFSRLLLSNSFSRLSYLVFLYIISYVSIFNINYLVNLPFSLGQSLIGINYFLLGIIISNILYKENKLNYKFTWTMLFSNLLFITLQIVNHSSLPDINIGIVQFDFSNLNFLYPTAIILVLLSITELIFHKYNSTYLTFLSSCTMLIFIFHPYTNNIAFLINQKLNFNPSYSWLIQFFLNLTFLSPIIYLKFNYNGKRIFKYV